MLLSFCDLPDTFRYPWAPPLGVSSATSGALVACSSVIVLLCAAKPAIGGQRGDKGGAALLCLLLSLVTVLPIEEDSSP